MNLPDAPTGEVIAKGELKGKLAVLISWINNINAKLASGARSYSLPELQSGKVHLACYDHGCGKGRLQKELCKCWYSSGLRNARRRDPIWAQKRANVSGVFNHSSERPVESRRWRAWNRVRGKRNHSARRLDLLSKSTSDHLLRRLLWHPKRLNFRRLCWFGRQCIWQVPSELLKFLTAEAEFKSIDDRRKTARIAF